MLQYIANIRLPTEKAHGAQIMKTCEAFARAGERVELLVAARRTPIQEDPFSYYGVEKNFVIKRLFVFDLIFLGRIGFWLESLSFAVSAAAYSILHPAKLVYSRDEFPLWVVSFFAKSVVWESHTGRHNFFTRSLTRAGKTCVVISDGLRALYQDMHAQAKMVVAPDAIDLDDFSNLHSKESARTRLGLSQDKKIILYIGRLDGWKGVSTLLDASLHLPEDFLVAIIGGEESEIEKMSSQYPRVIFLGARPYKELADNQAAADVLVLPNTAKDIISARYTSPMKLFSYMASERPIVASDLPSIREILSERSAAFFEADNSASLAETIETLLNDEEKMRSSARVARQEVERYTWDARAKTILSSLVG